jgi:hypothetical protein
MLFAIAVLLDQVNFIWVVPIAAIQNGNLYPVVTAVALNARIMKPANG